MDPYHSVFMLILTLFLVFLNGFFVLLEFSIVKVRRTRLEELVKLKVKNAPLALKITQNLDTYLSATQLGITLSSLGLGWIGEPAVAKILNTFFGHFFEAYPFLIHGVSFVIAFTLITLLHVVLGEIVPKSIAIAKAEQCVLLFVRPLYLFWLIFYPVIWFFDSLAAFFLRIFKIKVAKESESVHSEEELKIIVDEGLKGGLIDSIEGEIIKNAVDFSDTIAKEIMTPRKDMIALSADNSYEENIKIVMNTRHTRYPYYEESKDNILGMIHIRDLLQNTLSKKQVGLKNILREMLIVPESASIAQILTKMNKEQIHTALVVDEYGGTAGLLTMEDIIEEIMGDISDEHDEKIGDEYEQIDQKTFVFDGMMDLESIEEICGVSFDESIDQVTIGGYVFGLLGRLPVIGDQVSDEFCSFEIIEMDKARIKKVKLVILENLSENQEE